ncbi:MAG TPA: PEPxxWA-CTERM sorting domain-containing protein [Phenylobacterium sp.]
MRLRVSMAASSAVIGLLAAAGAHATVLLSGGPPTPQLATDTSFDVSFNGGSGGLANLSFVLNGFRSLDGHNTFEDDFTLSLNGSELLSGTFNLGGGGNDVVFLQPTGSTIDNVSGNGTAITWTGGQVNIATPLTLAAGENTLTFGYTSLNAPDFGFQDRGDEAWGVSDVTVATASSTSQDPAVTVGLPEPASWALMLVGFGGAGAMLRTRRRTANATS